MQVGTFLTQPNGSSDGNAKLKQVEVVVCTETCTLTGYTCCIKHQRLLDVLNQDFMPNSLPIGKDFMSLTDAEVSFPNREREFMASIYVRKSSILFVGEKSEDEPEKSEIEDRSTMYLAKAKNPIEVKIHMSPYTLTGQVYAQASQKLLDAVERADKFLPLTNVEIYPALDNTAWKFDFVAVNRDKIIYVCESLNRAKATLPAAEAIRRD
ncbi:MAG: hypothetical protein NTW48_00390 [Chloroflexi bacterium]|nr:hypothetical protein [Chloroflexota bacterium]